MNDRLLKLLLMVEMLNTEELEKLHTWIEHNLEKRAIPHVINQEEIKHE